MGGRGPDVPFILSKIVAPREERKVSAGSFPETATGNRPVLGEAAPSKRVSTGFKQMRYIIRNFPISY